jgi:hypothetical protein
MRNFKKIVFGIFGLLSLALLIAAFSRKDFSVEREITINRPATAVFEFLRYQQNQIHYNPWLIKYSISKMDFTGKDGQVGFRHTWNSANTEVGSGEESITKITNGKRIEIELHFMSPIDRWSHAWLTTDSLGENQTRVKWGFNGRIKYPLNVVLVFINMDRQIGNELAEGLDLMKNYLESNH